MRFKRSLRSRAFSLSRAQPIDIGIRSHWSEIAGRIQWSGAQPKKQIGRTVPAGSFFAEFLPRRNPGQMHAGRDAQWRLLVNVFRVQFGAMLGEKLNDRVGYH